MLIDVTSKGAAFVDPIRISHILPIRDGDNEQVGSEVYVEGVWTAWINSDLTPAQLIERINKATTNLPIQPKQGSISMDGSVDETMANAAAFLKEHGPKPTRGKES